MENKKKYRGVNWGSILLFILIIGGILWMANKVQMHQQEISYSTFVKEVEAGNVTAADIRQNSAVPTGRVTLSLKDDSSVRSLNVSDVGKVEEFLQENDVKYSLEDVPKESIIMSAVLPSLITLCGIFLLFMLMNRQNGGTNSKAMNFGKSRARMSTQNEIKVTFADVAGLKEEKEELEEIVDFLKAPRKYTQLGARIPKGVLLEGPPGTGKTLLAKAVAGEANVPFLSISGSDFVEMFVGVGASRVRDLFEQAKQKAPCIVFIDEIDAIGRARGKNAGFSGNDECENTLNQLLTEMDGFQTNTGVIVLAATNRADILDKALMRAGRFDRQIEVGLPDVKEREAIFNVHLRPLKLDPQLDREFLARQTPGFSGADIANVCNEAALIAARHNKKFVSKEDFLAAIDRIVGGLEKPNMPMTAVERRATAIHEAGHATVMWSLPQCDPVLKVTVVPRGRSLGATWYVPDERRIHVTNEALQERLAGLLGGRIAEEVNYGTLGAGALSDLERATETAYAMVAYYGMSKKIGPISYYDSSGTRDTFTKPFSEQTARDIDTEVRRIIEEAYAKARGIIERKSEQINRMADLLLEKETIYAEDIERILGPAAQVPREDDDPKKGVVVADDDAASGTAAPPDAPTAGTGTTQEGDAGSASGTKTAASGAANAEKSELK